MVQPISLSWDEMTAAEIQEMVKRDAVMIIPVGSTEQHGPHLPTGVDSTLAQNIAMKVAGHLSANSVPSIVAPTMPYGLAEHHMSLGGTITLDEATFRAILACVVRSGARQGFRKFVLLNGHGGNIHAITALSASMTEELDLPVISATYWIAAAKKFSEILETQDNVLHACEAETSLMLAVASHLVRTDKFDAAIPESGPANPEGAPGIFHRRPFSWYTSTGVLGDPRAATAKKGQDLISAASQTIAEALADPDLWKR